MIKFLDLHAQYLSIKEEIDTSIAETISSAAFVAGPAVGRFEQVFAAYVGAAHCVGVANGTDAIEIALEALALPAGSEVIVPANSFIASAEAVTRSGCKVVFADCDAELQTISLSDIERRLTPKTGAIIAVHLYGQPCHMTALKDLGRRAGVKIIEDCAQAHGARIGGRHVGTFGDIATFSFYPGKNLGAYGDAGAIVTDCADLHLKCRKIANHGRVAKYNHEFEGRNSRLDTMQAGILSVKLRHLDSWVDRRHAIAERYIKALRDLSWLRLPVICPGNHHAFHLFVVRLTARDRLAQHLREAAIETGIHYPIALPKLPAYAYLGQASAPLLSNSEDARVLSLPIGEHLSDVQVDEVIWAIRAFEPEDPNVGC